VWISAWSDLSIEEWEETHRRWQELVRYIEAEHLAHGVLDAQSRVPEAHLLAAVQANELVGFRMFLYTIKLRPGFVAHPAIRHLQDREEPGICWIKRVSQESDGIRQP
jgi:hypothetical protein